MFKKTDLSPKAEITQHPNGAKESSLDVDFTLIDPDAIYALARTLFHGAKKYGVNNWHGIDTRKHINHAIAHLYAYFYETDNKIPQTDDHLDHAFARIMMAVAIDTRAKDNNANV